MGLIKSIFKWSLLVIVILLIGCSEDKELTPEERANEIIDLLRAEDFETIHEQWFSEELQESISLNEIEDEWKATIHGKGEFVEVKSIESESRGEDLEVIEAEVEYEDITFDVRMIFNDNQHLDGFRLINLVSLPKAIIEEEIIVGEGTDHELGGTLTLPKENQENLPAVILVHGSGPQDRDETIFSNKPFRDIAWGLAEQGIAVVRYDKRTLVYGEEIERDLRNLTAYEETVEDAIRASELAKNDERIDEENVYIIGHSLGGMLAPRIDVQGGEFTGIIVLAGSTRDLWEISYDQNQYLIDMGLVDEEQEEELQALMEEEYEKGIKLRDSTLEEAKEMTIFGMNGYFLKEMEQYDTETLVQNLEKSILVLQGEEDFQVYYEKDFAIFEDLLGDKENATLISYEDLNHLFMDSPGLNKGTIQEYTHPGNVSEAVIEDIGNWILGNEN